MGSELAHSFGTVTAKEVVDSRARQLSLLQDVERCHFPGAATDLQPVMDARANLKQGLKQELADRCAVSASAVSASAVSASAVSASASECHCCEYQCCECQCCECQCCECQLSVSTLLPGKVRLCSFHSSSSS